MLHKFCLEIVRRRGNQEGSDILGEIHQVLFSEDAPNLKHVHLQVVSGLKDLQLSLLKDLTNLHLCFDMDAYVDGDILLDILHSSPSLRVLEISLYGPDQEEYIVSRPLDYQIPLPLLQELILRGCWRVDILDLILGHLDFPIESVEFGMTCDITHAEISDFSSLAHFLEQQSFACLSIYPDTSQFNMEFSERTNDWEWPVGSEFKAISYYPDTLMDNPFIILRSFNLLTVTHIILGSPLLKSETLRSIFVALVNLQYLCVTHMNEDEDDRPSSNFLLPKPYFKALMPRSRRSNPNRKALLGSVSETNEVTNHKTNLQTDETAGRGSSFPCLSLRTFKIRIFFSKPWTKLDESYLRTLEVFSRVREQAGSPINFIVILCRGGSGLAEGIDAWLHAHEGFPMEVRNEMRLTEYWD